MFNIFVIVYFSYYFLSGANNTPFRTKKEELPEDAWQGETQYPWDLDLLA